MDPAVIATAAELLAARHYPTVVAVTTEALEASPENGTLLLLRARAQLAMRRELDAQADLRDLIRIDPTSAVAYRLLGIMAARRDDHASGKRLLQHALRLDPSDRNAAAWLAFCDAARPSSRRPRLAHGTSPPVSPEAHAGPRADAESPPADLGDYLVATGVLTLARLRVAQTYQAALGIGLVLAVVTLGLASPQRVEWAEVAYQHAHRATKLAPP